MLRKFKCGGQSGGTCSNNDNKFFLRQGWKHSLLVLGWAFSCNCLTTRLVLSPGKYGCCHFFAVPSGCCIPFLCKLFSFNTPEAVSPAPGEPHQDYADKLSYTQVTLLPPGRGREGWQASKRIVRRRPVRL